MKHPVRLLLILLLIFTSCGKKAPSTTTTSNKSTSTVLPQSLGFREIATLDQPLGLIQHGNNFWVIQKAGQVVSINKEGGNKKTLLDISSSIASENERGLLGVAISPKHPNLMYLNYTDSQGNTQIVEYKVSADAIDVTSARTVLSITQPYPNHNGGNLLFGPDGYLYIGTGDGGSANDPQNRAQNLNQLLGKMLRIDPKQSGDKAYSVPASNPFVNQADARPEIWAWGLRNPWRYSFDSKTKDFWIGDVGQNQWEEIDHTSLAKSKGANFGWSRFEGNEIFQSSREVDNPVAPVHVYDHSNSRCSVTAGYVYRGKKIPALTNRYIFGDYCSGEIWSVSLSDPANARREPISMSQLVSFAQDNQGNLYALSQQGAIKQLVAA